MLYAILCYNSEEVVSAWTKEEDDAVIARLIAVQDKVAAQGRLGPVVRLQGTRAATTLRKGPNKSAPIVIDGPFAETKEQFLGFYLVECAHLDEAVAFANELAEANRGPGGYEIRPVAAFFPSGGKPS
ncbi:MAG TPA: YciI family protein [Polyangiales bacterium]|nr:YciI family protein [Polyangiales bacterium]